ncbi:MAG: creatininase family protein [Spirochaetota bacterium]
MRYEMMYPDQLRKAIDERWPLVWPIGVLEYHASHCCNGVDTLVVIRAFEELEREMNIVIFPPFYFGAASYAVGAPERNGTVHVRPETIMPFAKEVFTDLLRIGFTNIHGFVHHQSENFSVGMPTDLAFKTASRQAVFEYIEKERGEGWWGKDEMRDYYSQHDAGSDPFSWIQMHPFMADDVQKKYPVDHAGKQETSLMMAFCPEGVDMKRYKGEHWFVESAKDANIGYGNAAKRDTLESLRMILRP